MNRLDDVVRFLNPHPGFAGASIPIPDSVKKVADVLNRKTLTIKKAAEMIEKADTNGGKVDVLLRDKCIMFTKMIKRPGDDEYIKHVWRVIEWM